MTGPSRSASRMGKEQEVDSLTDLLVQGMSGGVSDVDQEDIYGICIKCGEKVSFLSYFIFNSRKKMLINFQEKQIVVNDIIVFT